MRASERRYCARSPSGGSMKLVPRPSTASPVNSAPAAGTWNAMWSLVCPGVCTRGRARAPPARTCWPSRRCSAPGSRNAAAARRPVAANAAAPGAWSGWSCVTSTAATFVAGGRATSSRCAVVVGPRVDHDDGVRRRRSTCSCPRACTGSGSGRARARSAARSVLPEHRPRKPHDLVVVGLAGLERERRDRARRCRTRRARASWRTWASRACGRRPAIPPAARAARPTTRAAASRAVGRRARGRAGRRPRSSGRRSAPAPRRARPSGRARAAGRRRGRRACTGSSESGVPASTSPPPVSARPASSTSSRTAAARAASPSSPNHRAASAASSASTAPAGEDDVPGEEPARRPALDARAPRERRGPPSPSRTAITDAACRIWSLIERSSSQVPSRSMAPRRTPSDDRRHDRASEIAAAGPMRVRPLHGARAVRARRLLRRAARRGRAGGRLRHEPARASGVRVALSPRRSPACTRRSAGRARRSDRGGAGDGTLAAGAARPSSRDLPMRVVAVDVAPARARALDGDRRRRPCATMPPAARPAVVLAHELLDNLPFRRLRVTATAPRGARRARRRPVRRGAGARSSTSRPPAPLGERPTASWSCRPARRPS